MAPSKYRIYGDWGARFGDPRVLATRFMAMIDGMREIDPRFSEWIWTGSESERTDGRSGYYPFDQVRSCLSDQIIDDVYRHERTGEPEVEMGYSMLVTTRDHPDSGFIAVTVSDGCEYSFDPRPSNSFEIDVRVHPENEPLISYTIFRSAMFLLAEIWEATLCQAYPDDLEDYRSGKQKIGPAWMTYLSPRLAPRVRPPSGVIVEHRPNGGLFMAATMDRFSTDNRDHRVAAHLIEVAAEPLDTLLLPYQEPYR